jgi:hypothetical protein
MTYSIKPLVRVIKEYKQELYRQLKKKEIEEREYYLQLQWNVFISSIYMGQNSSFLLLLHCYCVRCRL